VEEIYNDFIGIYKNAVSKEWCNEVINVFNSLSSEDMIHRHHAYDAAHISDTSIGLQFHSKELCELFLNNFYENLYPLYSKKYKLGNSILSFPMAIFDFKVQKTLPTEGYHVWHIEHGPQHPTTKNRIIAYTLYLNDVEEGGETEFLIQSLRIKPEQGTLVLWPAGYTHIHRGNPPLSGEKYIMTGWLEYDEEKYNQILNSQINQ